MNATLKLQLILIAIFGIIRLFSASEVGRSCELKPGQNGTCAYVKDCSHAKTLIKQRQRPTLCEFIGNVPVICCPINDTSNRKGLGKRVSKFKIPACALIRIGGIYEPPGMTDRPSVKRQRIFDHGGLEPPPSTPLPLPPLSPLPLLPPFSPLSIDSPSSLSLSLPPPLPPPPSPPVSPILSSLSLPPPPTSSSASPLPLQRFDSLPLLPPPPSEMDDYLIDLLDGHDMPPEAIAGGLHADTAEFPHMARLGIGQNKSSISWYCGGSLISDKFILTAAHCIYSRYGTINFASLGDSIGMRYEEIHEVVTNIVHPDYTYQEHYHDIALSELKDRVVFNFYISPACVHTELEIPESIRITVSGWGATGFGEDGTEYLLKADMDMYSYEECTKKYPNTLKKLPRGLDNETQVCAGGRKEVKDTCQGDSGGPIQMRGSNATMSMVYSIFGITSFGKICGVVNQPGVYVRIYPYLPWIESVIWKE